METGDLAQQVGRLSRRIGEEMLAFDRVSRRSISQHTRRRDVVGQPGKGKWSHEGRGLGGLQMGW